MSLESEIVGLCKAVTDNSTATAELSKAVIANTVAVQELVHVVACRVLPAPAQATPVAPEAREENPAPVVEPAKAEQAETEAPAAKVDEKPAAQDDAPAAEAEQAAGAPAPKMTSKNFVDTCTALNAKAVESGNGGKFVEIVKGYAQRNNVGRLRDLPESVWPNVIADLKAVVGV